MILIKETKYQDGIMKVYEVKTQCFIPEHGKKDMKESICIEHIFIFEKYESI